MQPRIHFALEVVTAAVLISCLISDVIPPQSLQQKPCKHQARMYKVKMETL